MAMQYGLGIDLGTTHTAAAVQVEGRVEVVRLGSRRAEIPSLVFVKPDGGLLIGEAAERRGQSEPGRLAREFKRRMGDPVPILVGGAPFSAHALTAKLLRHVLDTVIQQQDGPPAAITVTHPANWGPYKKEQLEQAIKLADAGPVRLRSEPEAAALQHATARRIANGETVAVYDLGGGTFDVAVLRREGEGFVLLGEPEGIEQLGGIDFDEAVFGHVLGVLGSMADGMDPNDTEAVASLSRLRRDCVEAKESLSFDTETMIPVALPGLHTRVRLNRSELEGMISPSLDDTITATQRALRTARVEPAQLSAILLAGGSSRIPLVSQLLSTEFQRPVVADPHPEHSIAMGAAVATAALLGGGSPFSNAAPPAGGSPFSNAAPPAGAAPAQRGEETTTLVDMAAGGLGPAVTPQRGGAGAYLAAPPISGPPAGTPPVTYSRGAVSIPGTTPPPPTPVIPHPSTPQRPTSGVPGNGGGNIPWPPPPLPVAPAGDKRNLVKYLGIGALVVALLAGGTTAALVLMNRKGNTGKSVTPPVVTTAPVASAPASPAQAFPTDTMLIRVDTGGDGGTSRKSKIYYFTPGSDTRTPLPNSQVGDVLPKWSHSRKQIALTHSSPDGKESSIYVMNADGSDRQKVADNAGGRVAWSADDKKMAFMKKFDGVSQIVVLNLATQELKQLTHSSTQKDDAMWSPDGKTIVYWLNKGGVKQLFELEVANPVEPGHQITGPDVGPANDPVYSPDGRQILFTRELDGNATSDIWLVNTDGSKPHRVTSNPAREMDPTWSPDGKWFAFVRGDYGQPTIVIERADGSGEVTLTKPPAREAHPCWF